MAELTAIANMVQGVGYCQLLNRQQNWPGILSVQPLMVYFGTN